MILLGAEGGLRMGEMLALTQDSGRYGPRSAAELDDVTTVFVGFGYKTNNLGWDLETNRPRRIWRPDV